jgi:glutathione peroxidase
MSGLFDLSAQRLEGQEESLAAYRGKVVLVVNVASKCGFTPQYAGLEAIWKEYGPRGLVILGFPCNQFGAQEPGDEAEIASFCSLTYNVSFPMFKKVDVNGTATHPVYKFLKSGAPGVLGTEGVKWNFTKFLVNREGQVVNRYAPTTKPEDLVTDIEKLL